MLPREEDPSGYRPQSEDSSREVEELLFAHWRAMSPADKAALFSRICRAEHELHLAGLAHRHPEATPRELELRAACLRLGRETVERALGERLPFED